MFKKKKKEDETCLFDLPQTSQQTPDGGNLENSLETNYIEINVEKTETTKYMSILPHMLVATCSFCASLSGGLCEGYSQILIETLDGGKDISFNDKNVNWIYYSFMIGWLAGSVPVGCFSLIGRKKTLIAAIIIRLMGWILVTFSSSFVMLLCGRLLLGVGVGVVYVLLSIYITEACHASVRGIVAASIPVGIQTGLLLTYIAGNYLEWRDLSEMCLVLTVVCLIPIILLPESPVWLTLRAKYEQARDSLSLLRGKKYNVTSELTQISNALSSEVVLCEEHSHSGKRYMQHMVLLASFIMADRLCGTPAILTFTATYFERIGSPITVRASYILVASLQLCAASISGTVIDCIGRRLLTLVSLSMMGVTLIFLVIFSQIRNLRETLWDLQTGWVPLFILLIYIVAYSLGLGVSIYVLMGELIPITKTDCYAAAFSLLFGALSFLTPSVHLALFNILTINGACILYAIACLWCAVYAAGYHKETAKLNYEELNLLSDGCLQMEKLG